MQAIILVGGEGTRLRPLTLHRLKSMVPMAGRMFLEYQLHLLKRHGVRDVVLSICHLPRLIQKAFGSGRRFGLRLAYAPEKTPLGTGGAMKNAAGFLRGSDPVVVLNGDVLTDIDLGRLLAFHRRQKAVATLTLTLVPDPSAFGLVVQDENQRVRQFLEKPSSDEGHSPWINAGVYLFEKGVFDWIPAGKPYSAERGLFPKLLEGRQRLFGFRSRDYWKDIGTCANYHQAHLDILEGRMPLLPADGPRPGRPGVWLGSSGRGPAGVVWSPPLIIGAGCRIAPGARVGESTVLGRRVRVGAGAILERSVVWDDVTIGAGAHLDSCVVANDCRIGRFAVVRPHSVLGAGTVIPDYSRV